MLETIHEFASDRFHSTDGSSHVEAAHAEFFASLVEQADPHIRYGRDQQAWVERLAAEWDNIRSAVGFGLIDAPEIALRIVGSIAFYVWLRGGFAETRRWVDETLAAGADGSLLWQARVLACGGLMAELQGDPEASARYADDALAAATAADDGYGVAWALLQQGNAAASSGDGARAREIYERLSDLPDADDDIGSLRAIAMNNLGDLAFDDRDWGRVIELCGLSSQMRRDVGNTWGAAIGSVNVAAAQREAGLLDDASRSLHQALEEGMEVGARMVVLACLQVASVLALDRNTPRTAATLLGTHDQLREELDVMLDDHARSVVDNADREARVRIGDRDFTRAYEDGRALLLEDAAALVVTLTLPADD
jgi:predicted negative regulator of RcsB-dependent stress response